MKANTKLEEKLLKDGDVISFKAMDDDYGRAEFDCCPVYRYGKLKVLYLYPAQQQNVKYYYKMVFKYVPHDFSIGSWTHKGIDPVWIWLHYWCKEHKCSSFRFYVPANSNCFEVSCLSNFSIMFSYR